MKRIVGAGIAAVVLVAGMGTSGAAGPRTFVFNGEGNNLNVYDAATGRTRTLISANDGQGLGPALDGERDINAQICFDTFRGSTYFIAGEDTLQGEQAGSDAGLAGWGWFKLSGRTLQTLRWEQRGKLVPTYNGDSDFNENYGCAFTAEHNLLLSDVGDQQFQGSGTGQLHLWFRNPRTGFAKGYDFDPAAAFPFHAKSDVPYCKIDDTITTAGQIMVDADGSALVASARPDLTDPSKAWGILRYEGLPTADPGCDAEGLVDGQTLVEAGVVTKSVFILDVANTPTPNAVAPNGRGGYYVSSVFNGVIAEYDANGIFQRRLLSSPSPLPPLTQDGPTPLGIGVDPAGRIWFADIGIVISDPQDIGPGDGNGRVGWVDPAADDGVPVTGVAPTYVDDGLAFPDGIGIVTLD